jgi:hypothetical protein
MEKELEQEVDFDVSISSFEGDKGCGNSLDQYDLFILNIFPFFQIRLALFSY